MRSFCYYIWAAISIVLGAPFVIIGFLSVYPVSIILNSYKMGFNIGQKWINYLSRKARGEINEVV